MRDDIPIDFTLKYLKKVINIQGGAATGGTGQSGPPASTFGQEIRGMIHTPITNVLRQITECDGNRLYLNKLLQYARTNIRNMIGPQYSGYYRRFLILETCSSNCVGNHTRDPLPALINRITQKIRPGVAGYLRAMVN